MGYKITELSVPNDQERIRSYIEANRDNGYALIYLISEMHLCRMKELDVDSINWPECLEARLFCENSEVHIFETEDGRKAVLKEDDGTEDTFVKKFQMSNKFKEMGDAICVKEYLSYDEDGQVYVALTRLSGIEREDK